MQLAPQPITQLRERIEVKAQAGGGGRPQQGQGGDVVVMAQQVEQQRSPLLLWGAQQGAELLHQLLAGPAIQQRPDRVAAQGQRLLQQPQQIAAAAGLQQV